MEDCRTKYLSNRTVSSFNTSWFMGFIFLLC